MSKWFQMRKLKIFKNGSDILRVLRLEKILFVRVNASVFAKF